MRRPIFLVMLLLLSIASFSRLVKVSSSEPADYGVRLEPMSFVFGPRPCVGETFSVTVYLDNLTNILITSIEFLFNSTFIEFIDDIVFIPQSVYPQGLLYEPITILEDGLDGDGELDIAYGGIGERFTGSGVFCTVTFGIAYQPMANEPDANLIIQTETRLWNDSDLLPKTFKNCSVTIYSLPSPDVNNDDIVDIFDIVSVATLYGHTELDMDWNPWADLAPQYGIIDIFDIVTCASHYGETY